VDARGLDAGDRNLLEASIDNYNGGPVGMETHAAITDDERSTIEDFYEPYLLQLGFIERTPRGRKLTQKAWQQLGRALEET